MADSETSQAADAAFTVGLLIKAAIISSSLFSAAIASPSWNKYRFAGFLYRYHNAAADKLDLYGRRVAGRAYLADLRRLVFLHASFSKGIRPAAGKIVNIRFRALSLDFKAVAAVKGLRMLRRCCCRFSAYCAACNRCKRKADADDRGRYSFTAAPLHRSPPLFLRQVSLPFSPNASRYIPAAFQGAFYATPAYTKLLNISRPVSCVLLLFMRIIRAVRPVRIILIVRINYTVERSFCQ